MVNKIKGIYKAGFRYISNIFVGKERELEIGCPTDVKHVAHIGWEGSTGTAPTWMKGFRTGPEFAATTIGNNGSSLSPWSSQDIAESKGDEVRKKEKKSGDEIPNIPKTKQKRKKSRSTSSPKSGSSSSSSRASRSAKSKSQSKFVDGNNKTIKNIRAKPIDIEVQA